MNGKWKKEKGIPVDVCYTLDENHWNNKMTLQLMVKDMKC